MNEIVRRKVQYHINGNDFEGCLLYRNNSRPDRGLLMAPNFYGITDNAIDNAARQVSERQAVFVLDAYGIDVRPANHEQANAAMTQLRADYVELSARVGAALAAFRGVAVELGVPNDRFAACGFCLGGACVLALARSGADVRATITFHALVDTPQPQLTETIPGPLLVLNGADDPMVSAEHKAAFKQEMDRVCADWQWVDFGDTVHSFTDPRANTPGVGVYNAKAARRAFAAMNDLLDEVFGAFES